MSLPAVTALLAALPLLTQAQTLSPVTVTAQPSYSLDAGLATKTDTPAREAPFATSTVSRELLQDRGVTSMNEALRTVPGVAAINGIGNANARYRYRGFLANNQLKNGFRQSVAFPVTEFQNVDTLEVLRGPASALYGRFEPGGVLNIVTKQALATPLYEAGFSLGSDGQRRLTADLGGPIGDAVRYRLNAAFENSDTYRDQVRNKQTFLAPAVQFRLGAQTTLDLEAELLNRKSPFDRGFILSPTMLTLPASRFLGEPGDSFDNNTRNLSAMLRHTLDGGVQLRAGLSSSQANSDGGYFFPIAGGATVPLLSPAGVLNRRFQTTADTQRDNTALLEATGKLQLGGMAHQWLAGVERNTDYADSRINRSTVNAGLNIYNPVYGAVPSPVTAAVVNTEASNASTALFVQDEISFSKQWRLTAGLRTERITSRFVDRATNITRESTSSATTPRLGLSWLPADNAVYFVNYSRSFSPEVTARALVGNAAPQPSEGKQLEAGGRWDVLDKKLQLGATVFDIRKTNVRVADPVLTTQDRQVGEQRSKGVELEITGRPVPQLQIVGSFTALDAVISKDTATLTGKQFAGTPKNSATLWSRYDFSRNFGAGAGVSYVGERFVDPANTLALPAYTRVDLALYGKLGLQTSWQLNVLNATNKTYFENGNTTGNFYPAMPRTVRVSLQTRF